MKKKRTKILEEIMHKATDEYINNIAIPKINKIIPKFFNKIHIMGAENLQNITQEEQTIYISNHKSLADIPLSAYSILRTKKLPRFIGGNNLLVPVFTQKPLMMGIPNLKKTGMISIDRTRFKKNDTEYIKTFIEYMKTFFKQKEDLLFYPEGGRSYNGKIQELKQGLIKLVIRNANENTKIVPVTNSYDFVIEAKGFEKNKSTKFGQKNKLKRFLKDAYLLIQYTKTNFDKNEAVFKFGEPIPVKKQSIEDVTNYLKNEFINMTTVNTSELLSYAIRMHEGNATQTELKITIETLLKITPNQNLHPRMLRYSKDPEKILMHGETTINEQAKSIIKYEQKNKVSKEFLINYYANSVEQLYAKLAK